MSAVVMRSMLMTITEACLLACSQDAQGVEIKAPAPRGPSVVFKTPQCM